MPLEDASPEGFTVRDRRGQGAGAEPAPPSERGGSAPPEAPLSPPLRSQAPPPEPSDLPQGGADLTSLFLILANSALAHLGEGPQAGGGAALDLTQAQFSIDLLRLLREKTEGHRTPEESHLIDGILYDLEMRFIRATREAR